MMIGIKKHSTVWLHILVSRVPGCGLVLGGGECRVDPGVNWVSALPLVPYLWPYYDRRVTSHSLQTNTLLSPDRAEKQQTGMAGPCLESANLE